MKNKMKQETKRKMLAAALGMALAAPIVAQAEGAYVGVNASWVNQDPSLSGGWDAKDDDTTGYKLYAGYGFNKNFGIEAGYVDFGHGSVAYTDGVDTFRLKSKPEAVYLAGTGTLPLNEKFSLFAKLGVSFNHVRVHDTGTDASDSYNETTPLVGIGASYSVTRNLAVVAEYENFGKIVDDDLGELKADMLSLGLRYSF